MDFVWTVTEGEGSGKDLLKIAATKELAEKYMKDRFKSYMTETHRLIRFSDEPDRYTWAHVNWKEYTEDEEFYFYDCTGFTFLIIEKWSVLIDK